MMTEKGCFAEALKAEIMERYGLREDQIQLQLTVHTTDLELGRTILHDFDVEKQETTFFPNDKQNCDFVRGEHIRSVYVHRKDGFYGTYINNNE
jgi:hypothetical protein